MPYRLLAALALCTLLGASRLEAQRASDGHPDLQGMWNNGTATPLQRPAEFANQALFTPAEAAEFERTRIDRFIKSLAPQDQLAADLNEIYPDRLMVLDDRRTSLIVDPPNGMLPTLLPQARARAAARPKRSYDDPETLTLDERCLLETAAGSSNAAPPMVPNGFGQNLYQIVQTPSYVAILTEVVHDTRIIRMSDSHLPPAIRKWLGDSIGRWDGGTLVVDTTNFTEKTHFRGSGERLHVDERFTRTDPTTMQYRVTVDDPDTWARPWTAEIPFKATDDRIYEYACHEANYSLENALRRARAQERERP